MSKLFSVHDTKSCLYGSLYTAPTNAVAIRQFADAANDASTLINKHPEDFSLWCHGEFDEETGEITLTEKSCLAQAREFIV